MPEFKKDISENNSTQEPVSNTSNPPKFEKAIIEKIFGDRGIEFQAAPDKVYPATTNVGTIASLFVAAEIFSFLSFLGNEEFPLPLYEKWLAFTDIERAVIIFSYLFFILANCLCVSFFKSIYDFRTQAMLPCFFIGLFLLILVFLLIGDINIKLSLIFLFFFNSLLFLLEYIKPTTLKDVEKYKDMFKF